MKLPAAPAACLTVLASIVTSANLGCGSVGAPQPPSLKIPAVVLDLSASRTVDKVHLHWTMPRRATDRVLLVGDQRVVICRNQGPGPCHAVGRALMQEGAPADYTDTLPPELAHGAPRLLTYQVQLTNHAGRDAGPSNPAYAAAGEAPPPLGPLSATATAEGIVLRWSAAATPAPSLPVRLHRTRILAPGEPLRPDPDETLAGVPQPIEQTLEATPRRAAGETSEVVDADALLDRTYHYAVERVAHVQLGGHTLEVTGPASDATVAARDVFAPAAPQGLDAVSDIAAGAIDLSWVVGSERDLAGYFVYRRYAGSGDDPARVSGPQPVAAPGWRDTHARVGVRYEYFVSAVDKDGNESPRSAPTQEQLTPPVRPN